MHGKSYSPLLASGKRKLKPRQDSTPHLLERLKYKIQYQMLVRMWSNRNAHSWLEGMEYGVSSTWEDGLWFLTKLNTVL